MNPSGQLGQISVQNILVGIAQLNISVTRILMPYLKIIRFVGQETNN